MNKAEFLRETIDIARQIETRFLELGARLYNIREKCLWKDNYDSYSEFLYAARINYGLASILAKIHKKYVVEGNLNQNDLVGIGYTNLYEAIPLIETDGVENTVKRASLLTRSEIKDEVREYKHGEHEHVTGEERWGICKDCGKFIKIIN